MTNDMPCRDCKERYLGCHSKCVKYQNAKKRNDELREKERMEKHINYEYWQTTTIVRRKGK